jgi:hypothetical protein
LPEERSNRLRASAVQIAEYMLQCQEYDSSIIKMIQDRAAMMHKL